MIDEWLGAGGSTWGADGPWGADGRHFAILYDLLTGHAPLRVLHDDSPQLLGALLARLAAPKMPAELLDVLRALEADRTLAARMPRFKGKT